MLFYRLGPSWEHAQKMVAMEKGYLFTHPLRILLFPGLLSEYSAYDFANNAYKVGRRSCDGHVMLL